MDLRIPEGLSNIQLWSYQGGNQFVIETRWNWIVCLDLWEKWQTS